METLRIHHTGITISNLERSLSFYRDVLGMEDDGYRSERPANWSDDFIGKNIGIPGTQLKIAWLTKGDVRLELIEYVVPKGQQRAKTQPSDVGNAHVAFQVDDMEAWYNKLTGMGIKFAAYPPTITEGPTKGVSAIYLWDPDGINVELLYRPPGITDDTYRHPGKAHSTPK
jgi:catechol 2,3-dioxygenase-like lactoylglutathione lyase family enzyme